MLFFEGDTHTMQVRQRTWWFPTFGQLVIKLRHNKRLSHNHIKTNKMSNFLIETNNIWISGQFLCTLSAWVIAPWSLIRVLPIYRRRMDGGNDFTQIPEITEKLSQNFKLPLHNHRHRLLKKSDGKYLQRLITIIRHC